MSATTTDDWSEIVGRTETREEVIQLERAAALAATLDLAETPSLGNSLPPGWHWLYFNTFVRRSEIGHDGHPRRGGFLPDVGLPRRMWAGGRLAYLDPLEIGQPTVKESTILDITAKSGRAGRLVFVTLRHRLYQNGTLCIEEEQDIAYREAAGPNASKPGPIPVPHTSVRSGEVTIDPVLLFRYSALTSNGHRIHYDRTYAQAEEGYRDLVVHGPLTATLLQGFASEGRRRLVRFDFRGVAPIMGDRTFSIHAGHEECGILPLWAQGPDGGLAMQASATFGPE